MLTQIYIENVAVIEKSIIDFSSGFNVFTGETGAGKSILIDALSCVLGFRSSKDIVRTGEKRAFVRACFDEISKPIIIKLKKMDITHEDDLLILSREISSEGKNICKINQNTVSVSMLGEIGSLLIDIHGQHDNQDLINNETHSLYVDYYGDLNDEVEDYRVDFKKMCEFINEINSLNLNESEKTKKIESLDYLINEIENADLDEKEEQDLQKERLLILNSEKIANELNLSYFALSGSDLDDISESNGAVEMVRQVRDSMETIEEYYPDFNGTTDKLSDMFYQLDDLKTEIADKLSEININPKRIEQIEERLDIYYKLKNKYSMDISSILKMYSEKVNERENIEISKEKIIDLKKKYNEISKIVMQKAQNLSQKRIKIAKEFIEKVEAELTFLNMPNTKLVSNHKTTNLTKKGMDSFEFLISANAGEKAKPIGKIASGGELSRIMLAIKNVIATKDTFKTLVFDEIDAGISGKAAQKVGFKLKETASNRQIICVTHLAQIACFADNHLLIEKNVVDNRTFTEVKNLDFNGKMNELARIISGENITEATLKTAEEMLLGAK